MPMAGRIRVLIAGNVYVKRALVRRFLEDDGYAVVGDVMSADAVIPAVRAGQPDAVVLDEDLASQGAGIAAIRGAAADVRVIVFTAAAAGTGAPPPGADGYLDKGVGLAALTAALGRLFFEPTVPLEPLLVGASVGMAPALSRHSGRWTTRPVPERGRHREVPSGTSPAWSRWPRVSCWSSGASRRRSRRATSAATRRRSPRHPRARAAARSSSPALRPSSTRPTRRSAGWSRRCGAGTTSSGPSRHRRSSTSGTRRRRPDSRSRASMPRSPRDSSRSRRACPNASTSSSRTPSARCTRRSRTDRADGGHRRNDGDGRRWRDEHRHGR